MNKNIKNILKQKIIINNLVKINTIKLITKSITQNNNIKNKLKIYNNYLVTKHLLHKHILSKKHKVCLLTGKHTPVIYRTSFSRYVIKNFILYNKFTNIKKHNW